MLTCGSAAHAAARRAAPLNVFPLRQTHQPARSPRATVVRGRPQPVADPGCESFARVPRLALEVAPLLHERAWALRGTSVATALPHSRTEIAEGKNSMSSQIDSPLP